MVALLKILSHPVISSYPSPTVRRTAPAGLLHDPVRVSFMHRVVHRYLFIGGDVSTGKQGDIVKHPKIGVARMFRK